MLAADSGSSPRLRGTPVLLSFFILSCGIIPALAGNTCRPRSVSMTVWDHPRACGEHVHAHAPTRRQTGSSPRLRGTPAYHSRQSPATGIIPALAGNTSRRMIARFGRRDHPRACGEHVVPNRDGTDTVGSSPRLRGTPTAFASAFAANGIIPALAGNTTRSRSTRRLSWDHPRACGEHRCLLDRFACSWGSSPRLRGTPSQVG